MNITKSLKILVFILITPILLSSCAGPDGKLKIPGGDARKTPADPKERVKKILRKGKVSHLITHLETIQANLTLRVQTNCGGRRLM